jgi:hypothetical protein
MRNPFYPLSPITDFRTLRTGRKKETAFVTDENRILFVTRVLHSNLYTSKTVTFENRKVFHTDSQTIDGKKVHLFWPCDNLAEKWEWQQHYDRNVEFADRSAAPDVFAQRDCVAIVQEKPEPRYRHELMLVFAKLEIRKELENLNLRELRRLTSILDNVECGCV